MAKDKTKWRFLAEVESVDLDRRRVSLWVESGDIVDIPIPSNMPAWALCVGVGMLISIPVEQQYPQDYGKVDFLDFEELPFVECAGQLKFFDVSEVMNR